MQLPNSNPIFAGRTPLDYILRGGTPAMDTVRRLLDARRGGAMAMFLSPICAASIRIAYCRPNILLTTILFSRASPMTKICR